MKIVLLPGMDGTGELFSAFIAELPATLDPLIVRYPNDRFLPYKELLEVVRLRMPQSEPFVLLAESFSTPLAIQLASINPPNLKALILITGFATSPVQGLRRLMLKLLAPIIFRVPISRLGIKFFLIGSDAPDFLITSVCSAIRLAQPTVLSGRLRAVLACDVFADLQQVSVPLLYVAASQDRLVSNASGHEIVHANPEFSFARIDGPHLILQREPVQAAKIVISFIQKQSAPEIH